MPPVQLPYGRKHAIVVVGCMRYHSACHAENFNKLGATKMYLDPGFGSMIIQVLIASLAACAVFFGVFRTKIAAFFKSKRNKGDDAAADDDNDDFDDDFDDDDISDDDAAGDDVNDDDFDDDDVSDDDAVVGNEDVDDE